MPDKFVLLICDVGGELRVEELNAENRDEAMKEAFNLLAGEYEDLWESFGIYERFFTDEDLPEEDEEVPEDA